MLVGLEFDKGTDSEFKEEYGVAVAKALGTKSRVLEPASIDEYVEAVRAYNPSKKESLVLLATHFGDKSLSVGKWRATDIAFNQKGGVLFGDLPEKVSTARRSKLPEIDEVDFIATSAHFYGEKAKHLKTTIKDYIGRSDSDPHTLVLGFSPSWPRLSVTAEALIAGLPDGGEDGPWWWGVGFFTRRNKSSIPTQDVYRRVLEEFPYASRVVVSAAAQDVMDELGEPYQRAGDVRFKTLPEGQAFGKELRRLGRLDSERVVE